MRSRHLSLLSAIKIPTFPQLSFRVALDDEEPHTSRSDIPFSWCDLTVQVRSFTVFAVQDDSTLLGRLHEFDSSSVGVANIDHTFSGVRARAEGLRFASGAPPGCGDCIQDIRSEERRVGKECRSRMWTAH